MPIALDTQRQTANGRLLSELLAAKRHLLLRQARKHAQLEADAEEALQAAYALFIERYDGRLEALPWLLTTIKREAWRIAKRAHRRRELAITAAPCAGGQGTTDLTDAFPDETADPSDLAESSELLERRRDALERLKPDQRRALLLLGFGYSYAEIAESCGWTMSKVNHCLSEGRSALRANDEITR